MHWSVWHCPLKALPKGAGKLDSHGSSTHFFPSPPPPLDTSSSPSVGTPTSDSADTTCQALPPRRARNDEDNHNNLFFARHKHLHLPQNNHLASADEFTSDDLLFPPDEDDDFHLPLFPSASPLPTIRAMPSPSEPIQIGGSRQNSNSPRNQTSNLTAQLQQSQSNRNDSAMPAGTPDLKGRQESTTMLGTTPYGARQIPMPGNQRRESLIPGGSLMGGMSWGGISMGSFIRDE